MKKNITMRIASVLLVAVLLSACAVGGTFAKYVTTANSEDAARVAKFGVNVTVSGNLFDETYKNAENGNTDGTGADAAIISVSSSNGDSIVAPGTRNDKGLKIGITGKPEVAVKLRIDVGRYEIDESGEVTVGVGFGLEGNPNNPLYIIHGNKYGKNLKPFEEMDKTKYESLDDVYDFYVEENFLYAKFLYWQFPGQFPSDTTEEDLLNYAKNWALGDMASDYPDYVPGQGGSVGALDISLGNYFPIKYTLKQTASDGNEKIIIDGGKLYEVGEALSSSIEAEYPGMIIPANTDLSEVLGEYTITWEWPYEQGHDREDTILGNLIAGKTDLTAEELEKYGGSVEPKAPITDYNLYASIILNITVTQVD